MNVLMRSNCSTWLTPHEVWSRAVGLLGGIDLDPCAEPIKIGLANGWNIPALEHWSFGSLERAWTLPLRSGISVFMNPPYDRQQTHAKFVDKILMEYQKGNVKKAVVLLASRTETSWYQNMGRFPRCHVDHRLSFLNVDGEPVGTATFPSVIFGLGVSVGEFSHYFASLGEIVVREGGRR